MNYKKESKTWLEAKFKIKDNEKKEYLSETKDYTKRLATKKKTKEEAISEIQKWKKDTINKTIEKEGSRVCKVIDPYFCIFLDWIPTI